MLIKPSVDELGIDDRFLAVTLIAKRARDIEQGKRPILQPRIERAVSQAAVEVAEKVISCEDTLDGSDPR